MRGRLEADRFANDRLISILNVGFRLKSASVWVRQRKQVGIEGNSATPDADPVHET